MREIFPLSDATHDTLEDNVKRLVAGWQKSKTHIYDILSGVTRDPFPEFQSMYRGALKAGISTALWDAELEQDRRRYGSRRASPASVTVARVHKEAFEAIDAMLNGKSGEDRKRELRDLIVVCQEMIEAIDAVEERGTLRPVA